ncbi:hypothetical protein IW492_11345 [Enterococcus sp. BWB1-3]|uniref:hypothetical protein n=1 Tax=Enterococcus sp. BWB1-3 TaxID=2787713 RepID=UPI00192106D1|nr:hypothetical protein [Enterococcus sp. BWB1-3]MBL1229826.1 hypothetical protein [Enterococcus sp. BWB1-3]
MICGITFVGFVWLTASGKEITVMQPLAWAMGSTGVTTIGKIYDQDGNVISSIPGYTNPYGNVTTQNPAKDVGNGITLGPRPEDMAAGGMYTGIYPSVSGHPFGLYEDAPYHTNVGNSVKSKKPIDGQHALDNSVPISANTDRRVAISNGEIVILDQTSTGLDHGHVEEWTEVYINTQTLLRKLGWVNKKGKIIKKEEENNEKNEFTINDTCKIVLEINPDSTNDDESTPLYYFDWCDIYLVANKTKYLVFNDYLIEGIKSFYNTLKLVEANNYPILEEHFELGEGYYINEEYNLELELSTKFPMWGSRVNDTNEAWIYNYKNEIYLEMSPIYPYHYLEIPEGHETYKEFKKNLK